jgi:outer membrane protein TolC
VRRAIVTLGALLPLAACAVGPDYRPPELNAAPAYRNVSGNVSGDLKPAPDWWRAFKDPVLDALEEKALAQNLDVAQSIARVEQSRAAAGAAGAARLPVFESDPQAAAVRASRLGQNRATYALFPQYPRYLQLYDLTAGASWELDLFGGLKRQSEAAEAEFEAAQANLAGMRVSVAGDIADAYVQLRLDQQRLALAQRLTRGAVELVDLVTRNWESGFAPRSEVDQAQANLAQALAAQAPLRADIEVQLNRLAVLTGEIPEAGRAALESAGPIPVRAEALAAYRSAVLRAAEDVEDALILRREQAEASAALHRSEAALQHSFDSARSAYASGTASRIELIEADRQLVLMQDQAAAADAQTARAAVALVRALGA